MSPSSSTAETSNTAEESFAVSLIFEDNRYEVMDFDEFTFVVDSTELSGLFDKEERGSAMMSGSFECGNEILSIQFRKRSMEGSRMRFAFYDLSIKARKRVLEVRQNLRGGAKDTLQTLSYDDLARGGEPAKSSVGSTVVQSASVFTKMLVLASFVGIIAAIFITIGAMIMQRSTIDVKNGVIVGNYLPVSAPQQSILAEVFVNPGEEVKKGTLLARLTKNLPDDGLALIEAKLRRAESETEAYRSQLTQLHGTFKYAEMKIDGDLRVIDSELQLAQSKVRAAETQIKRLQPLRERSNVPLVDYDAAVAALESAKAEVVRCNALRESLEVTKKAAALQIFVGHSGASNPILELQTKIAVADAATRELQDAKSLLQEQMQPIEIYAPSNGTVYAIYRSQGETVKVADHLMALSLSGDSWATGTVSSELALQIYPGQEVEIAIPSMGTSAVGSVAGIGHRAVYGQGGYHTEFRSSPLEVPIRVAMNIDEQKIPSGLRLNMVVRLRDPLETAKAWLQENVAARLAWFRENADVEAVAERHSKTDSM